MLLLRGRAKFPHFRIEVLVLSFLMLITLLAGCSGVSGAGGDIRGEVVASLIQVSKVSTEKIDAELDKIDRDIYRVAEDQEKLRQILTPALEWIELQKAKVGEYEWGTWDTKVSQEGLTEFQNDRYRVSTLEFLAKRVGTSSQELKTIIKITDLDTNFTYDWDNLDSGLEEDMAGLIEMRQAKQGERELITATLTESVAYWQEWEIKKINDTTYIVSGLGLGWSEKLAAGTWAYNKYSGTITPEDNSAKWLKQRLEARF